MTLPSARNSAPKQSPRRPRQYPRHAPAHTAPRCCGCPPCLHPGVDFTRRALDSASLWPSPELLRSQANSLKSHKNRSPAEAGLKLEVGGISREGCRIYMKFMSPRKARNAGKIAAAPTGHGKTGDTGAPGSDHRETRRTDASPPSLAAKRTPAPSIARFISFGTSPVTATSPASKLRTVMTLTPAARARSARVQSRSWRAARHCAGLMRPMTYNSRKNATEFQWNFTRFARQKRVLRATNCRGHNPRNNGSEGLTPLRTVGVPPLSGLQHVATRLARSVHGGTRAAHQKSRRRSGCPAGTSILRRSRPETINRERPTNGGIRACVGGRRNSIMQRGLSSERSGGDRPLLE